MSVGQQSIVLLCKRMLLAAKYLCNLSILVAAILLIIALCVLVITWTAAWLLLAHLLLWTADLLQLVMGTRDTANSSPNLDCNITSTSLTVTHKHAPIDKPPTPPSDTIAESFDAFATENNIHDPVVAKLLIDIGPEQTFVDAPEQPLGSRLHPCTNGYGGKDYWHCRDGFTSLLDTDDSNSLATIANANSVEPTVRGQPLPSAYVQRSDTSLKPSKFALEVEEGAVCRDACHTEARPAERPQQADRFVLRLSTPAKEPTSVTNRLAAQRNAKQTAFLDALRGDTPADERRALDSFNPGRGRVGAVRRAPGKGRGRGTAAN